MKLGGQDERGYAMATLLISMGLMAIVMSAALPSWSQLAQREKEAEYLFRANQYALAVLRFQKKTSGTAGQGMPAPSVDYLVEQRFLRKKYKDPLSGQDFVPVLAGNAMRPGQPPGQAGSLVGTPGQPPGQAGQPGQQPAQTQLPSDLATAAKSLATDTLKVTASTAGSGQAQPLNGVTSASKGTAIRLFKGQQTTYDQWAVTSQDVNLHLGGQSVGTRFAMTNVAAGAQQPGQGNQGNQGQGGLGGLGPGMGGPQGTGGMGTGGAGNTFGSPGSQGTSVFPQVPSGIGSGGGQKPPSGGVGKPPL